MELECEKLIITAALPAPWIFPDEIAEEVHKRWEISTEEYIDEAYRCYEVGASILHIHGEKNWPKEKWAEVISGIREKCDGIIQMGLARNIEDRMGLMDLKPDMMSVHIAHQAEYFAGLKEDYLHTHEEIRAYLKLCDKWGVKPELEAFHTGAIWNLNYLLKENLLKLPPYVTLFFGWPGAAWSPATLEDLTYKIKLLPQNCVWNTSVVTPNGLDISNLTMMVGGHVRVGTEDYPFLRPGVLAKDNSELVSRIARISRELNREVATPSEARKIIGI